MLENLSHHSTDKLLEVAGDSHKYQNFICAILFLISLTCEIGYYAIPLMETFPIISYVDDKGRFHHQVMMQYSLCKFKHTVIEAKSKSTWVLDYNIYCDKFKVSMLGTLMCIGGFIGGLLLNYLKKFGTRFCLQFSSLIFVLATCFFFFKKNLMCLYFINFLYGMSNIMSYMLRVNIMCEITGKGSRASYNNIVITGISTSVIFFYLLFERNVKWHYIYFGSASLLLFSLFLFTILTVENFRYYFVNKDFTNLIASAKYVAQFNGLHNTEEFCKELKKYEKLMNRYK